MKENAGMWAQYSGRLEFGGLEFGVHRGSKDRDEKVLGKAMMETLAKTVPAAGGRLWHGGGKGSRQSHALCAPSGVISQET